ncbi:MAG: hypothetical protein H8E41_02840 [Desulfobulbaceae bacterium]|uniref:Uncharacterized protein n=1 Tax=Candidatus Desulfobia pelagia TaxID=2841692 RepID=A0A8J6NDP5_9BACT|nr:hypothetical protein [Candidatus Desulfobia pelagia]
MTTSIIKKIELQGILVVNDFDTDGNPIRFALLTDDENRYILEPGQKNTDILFGEYNRERVTISGEMRFDGNKNIIDVQEIQILKKAHGNPLVDIL